MNNQKHLDQYYNKCISNLRTWLPDGLVTIDLNTLHQLDLLHFHNHGHGPDDPNLTRYFQVTESEEKLTLVNEEFVIWISPSEDGEKTVTLVALNGDTDLHLELGFVTQGIYNQSHLVLKILEKFLLEIHTTESVLKKFS